MDGKGALADVELAQVLDRIRDRLSRARRPATPRRIVRAIFAETRARRSFGLPPFPGELVNAAAWLLIADDER